MKKHIVCFGDSNTHGYCADPNDTADHTDRFTEDERWTCLLQKALGEDYLVLEEGLSGRTTVFRDPLHECMSGLDVIYSTLMSHEPVDLLIIMLGTNDTKERFYASPACIGIGMERLAIKAETVGAWRGGRPNILIVAPPHIGAGTTTPPWARPAMRHRWVLRSSTARNAPRTAGLFSTPRASRSSTPWTICTSAAADTASLPKRSRRWCVS